jgi:hypothetical protein
LRLSTFLPDPHGAWRRQSLRWGLEITRGVTRETRKEAEAAQAQAGSRNEDHGFTG